MTKPNPNEPIWHQNPLDQLSDRVSPLRPGAQEPYSVPETDANPGRTKPVPTAPKYP
jgi:hypothetical protein